MPYIAKEVVKILEAENNKLRAMVANGPGPCVYCDLSREEWAKCMKGFPGCARGDDAMLCPHVGASLEAEARIRELEKTEEKNMNTADEALAKYDEIMAIGVGSVVELDFPEEVYENGMVIMTVLPLSGEERPWRFPKGTKIKVTGEPYSIGFRGVAAVPSGRELHRVMVSPEVWPHLTVLEERNDEQKNLDGDGSGASDHGGTSKSSGSPGGDQD